MQRLDLKNGRHLAYRDQGQGQALVLVHGSPGEGRAWARVLPHLEGKFRIVTPDLPGYGESDPAHLPGTQAKAAAIAALIRAIGQPVWLCGHSYGGNVALHAALEVPEALLGLGLFEPVLMRALELAGEHVRLAAARQFFSDYIAEVESGAPDAVGTMIDYWFGQGAYRRLPPKVIESLRMGAARNALDVRAAFAETLTRDDMAAFPVLARIVHGDAGPQTAPAIARALRQLLPRAALAAIPGAGHGMLDSHPAEVAAEIRALTSRA